MSCQKTGLCDMLEGVQKVVVIDMAKPPTAPFTPPRSPIRGQPGALPGKHDGNDDPPPPKRK